jgi:hypothetical protein
MAMKVEKMAQQKEIEKEQFKAVLKQKDDELAQIKERYHRELDNNTAAHQEHLRNMENKISEVEADHDTKKQSQRELELRLQDVASQNALLEAELVRRDQNQEDKDIAESILRSQEEGDTIDVDAEEAKSEINATPRDDEYASTKSHQDGNITPTEGSVPQSPFQPGSASQATNQAQQAEAPQSNETLTASPLSALERGLLPKPVGKRVRGLGKAKSPAAKAKEDSPLPDMAGVTPPGPAEELSSSSGDTKKAKGPRTNQKNTAGQQNLSDAFAKTIGSEL